MDERAWTDLPLAVGQSLRLDGVTVTHRELPTAHLVSGALDIALNALAPGAPCLGLAEDGRDAPDYAVRISRDSVLIVTKQALTRRIGWQSDGFGISEASDVYAVFDVAGPDAQQVLAQGGISVPLEPSPSAAIQFAGLTVLLIRRGGVFQMFVPAAHVTYVSGFLQGMDLPGA